MGVFNASDEITAEEFAGLTRVKRTTNGLNSGSSFSATAPVAATTGGAALKRLTADAAQR